MGFFSSPLGFGIRVNYSASLDVEVGLIRRPSSAADRLSEAISVWKSMAAADGVARDKPGSESPESAPDLGYPILDSFLSHSNESQVSEYVRRPHVFPMFVKTMDPFVQNGELLKLLERLYPLHGVPRGPPTEANAPYLCA
jgi:hypothetical protein